MMAVMIGYQLPGVPSTHLTRRVQVRLLHKFKDKDCRRQLPPEGRASPFAFSIVMGTNWTGEVAP